MRVPFRHGPVLSQRKLFSPLYSWYQDKPRHTVGGKLTTEAPVVRKNRRSPFDELRTNGYILEFPSSHPVRGEPVEP